MYKSLYRILVLLLVPSMSVDPALAVPFNPAPMTQVCRGPETLARVFSEQALSSVALSATRLPLAFYRPKRVLLSFGRLALFLMVAGVAQANIHPGNKPQAPGDAESKKSFLNWSTFGSIFVAVAGSSKRRPSVKRVAQSWRTFLTYPDVQSEPSIKAVTRHLNNALDGYQIGAASVLSNGSWFVIGGQDSTGRWHALLDGQHLRLDLTKGLLYVDGRTKPTRLKRSSGGVWLIKTTDSTIPIQPKNPWLLPATKRITIETDDEKMPNDSVRSTVLSLRLGGKSFPRNEKPDAGTTIGHVAVSGSPIAITFPDLYFDHLETPNGRKLTLSALGFGSEIVKRIATSIPQEVSLVFTDITHKPTLKRLSDATYDFARAHRITLHQDIDISEIGVSTLLVDLRRKLRLSGRRTAVEELERHISTIADQSVFGRMASKNGYRSVYGWGRVNAYIVSFIARRPNTKELSESKETIYLLGHKHIHPFDSDLLHSFLFGISENPSAASFARETMLMKWLASDRHQSLLKSMQRDIALLKQAIQEHGEGPVAIGIEVSDHEIEEMLEFAEDYLPIVHALSEKLSTMGIPDPMVKASELFLEVIGSAIYLVLLDPEFQKRKIQLIGLGDSVLRDEISKIIASFKDKQDKSRTPHSAKWNTYRLKSIANEQKMIGRLNEFAGPLIAIVGERHVRPFRDGLRRPFKEIIKSAA